VQVKTCLRFTEVTWFLVFCSQESWFFGRGWVVIHETLVFKESKGILRRNDSNYEMSNLPLSMCMLFGIAQLMLLNIHQKLKGSLFFLELFWNFVLGVLNFFFWNYCQSFCSGKRGYNTFDWAHCCMDNFSFAFTWCLNMHS